MAYGRILYCTAMLGSPFQGWAQVLRRARNDRLRSNSPTKAGISELIVFQRVRLCKYEAVAAWVDVSDPVSVVSPYVMAEVDYPVLTPKSVTAELALREELPGGAYESAQTDIELAQLFQRDAPTRWRCLSDRPLALVSIGLSTPSTPETQVVAALWL